LIFKDIARLTQILCDENRPVQLVFAGKAHPADREGCELIKTIHEISLMPQFKGKIFLLENYNIGMSRYLISGVDVWLNNPRRPMEASGTSGEKASVNGVVNFSVLDGWWAEGYDGTNGWSIGNEMDYSNDEEQDKADSNSIYHTLENQIIPAYYNKDRNGISKDWIKLMKNSIRTTGGRYSMARQVVDYVNDLYIPLCNLNIKYFQDLNKVIEYAEWKKQTKAAWESIEIEQGDNVDNAKMVAGSKINVKCSVNLANINENNANVQVYFGQFLENGTVKNVYTTEMKKVGEENGKLQYEGTIELPTGGNFGYTFRVMPKHEMLLDSENMNLVKWLTK
jgi:starch phosphorylase